MNHKHLFWSIISLITLEACGSQAGNPSKNEAQAVDQGASNDATAADTTPPEMNTTSTEEDGTAEDAAEEGVAEATEGEQPGAPNADTYLGAWHLTGTSPDHDGYMVLLANNGATCASDGKSQSSFDLEHEDGVLRMGDYGFGSGDTLEVLNGGMTLRRTGQDKGVEYIETYTRFTDALPDWCTEQL